MTTVNSRHSSGVRPLIAVLAAHWGSSSEEGWLTRQVAGALACVGQVHIVTPDGLEARRSNDGAFTVHRLGSPIDPDAEFRRDLLIDGLVTNGTHWDGGTLDRLAPVLDRGLLDPWSGAIGVLGELHPDVVVIAGHRNVGALTALESGAPGTPMTLLALGGDERRMAFPRFAPVFERADSVLVVTEAERQTVLASHRGGESVHRIGAPLAANPTALTEPNTWVGETDYILVVTNSGSEEDHPETELGRLIRLRFPDNPVGICHTDCFRVWHEGRVSQGWAVERSIDMARLMAWAQVTVDLHPTRLFARRCVDSLLYGTPVVVPADSRAREHADRGRGGLWFSNPAELTWCVDALLDPPTRATFGAQGRSYAEAEYGSTEEFIDRVAVGCGLAPMSRDVPATV